MDAEKNAPFFSLNATSEKKFYAYLRILQEHRVTNISHAICTLGIMMYD